MYFNKVIFNELINPIKITKSKIYFNFFQAGRPSDRHVHLDSDADRVRPDLHDGRHLRNASPRKKVKLLFSFGILINHI
jgi:hypothetical protein